MEPNEEISDPTTAEDDVWSGGFVCGLLTARYYALRHSVAGDFYRAAAPTETPDVVYSLMTHMCRSALDQRLFEQSWTSLDRFLLCETEQELQTVLTTVSDLRVQ